MIKELSEETPVENYRREAADELDGIAVAQTPVSKTAPESIIRRLISAPMVRAQVAAGERRTGELPRPTDHPSGHARGPNSHRVLLVGSGPAVGWGVASHELGLPGALARALSTLTGFGYLVDVIAEPSMDASTVLRALSSAAPDRYDAVVITIGVNDALSLTPLDVWTERVHELITGFLGTFPSDAPLFLVGIQPIESIPVFNSRVSAAADEHVLRLNQATHTLTSLSDRTIFLPLHAGSPPPGVRYRTRREYTEWASQLAPKMVPHISAEPHDAREGDTPTSEGEARRQLAESVRAAAALDSELVLHLNGIAVQARSAFRTQNALIALLGPDALWNLAETGPSLGEVPRQLSLCATTIQSGNALVVRDTLADPRFCDNPLVTGGPQIRFYAGFPIEAPSGVRIGALCVVDIQPRRQSDDVNEPLLRELALKAQRELWRHLHE
ncbi:GAF domain-containing protein [Salinibacterium sp. PAMC 21357]|uniref:GAF domain-containing protein n=1 Tax=Salinibacterium sp. PAMC 21357 TaxID=1112215 RepID=UPI0002892696|nr:GAF domain-containing protein [Salinibacterium sp. PAMC 21357]